MPRNAVAARRYAQAFFQLTEKSKEALSELRVFDEVLKRDPAIFGFFANPIISSADKILALADLKSKFPSSIMFLEALVEAGRIEDFEAVIVEFSRLCDEKLGELSVSLESASALSAPELEDIRTLLEEKWKKKLKIETRINASLIGGFVAQAPGKILDASVSNQLQSLEEQVFA